MKVYHFNRDRIDHAILFDVMSGLRNQEGSELYKRIWSEGAYDLVAEVEGTDPELAWRKTQNIDDSWSLEPDEGTKAIGLDGKMGHRSSMVGDIVVIDDVMHVADTLGFVEIGPVVVSESAPRP